MCLASPGRLTDGQDLLSLQQVRVEGHVFISSVSSLSFLFLFYGKPFYYLFYKTDI